MKGIVTISVLALVLAGCASHGLIERRADVAIVAASPGPQRAIDVSGAMGGATWSGAGTGASVGASAAGFCGPLSIVCLPATALVGAIGGTIAGAAVDVATYPSGKTLDKLRERSAAYSRSFSLDAQLTAAVTDRAASRWNIVPSSATTLRLQVDSAALVMRDDKVSIDMKASALVIRDGKRTTKGFAYRGSPTDVRLWLAEDGRYVEDAFRLAYDDIAARVIAELDSRP